MGVRGEPSIKWQIRRQNGKERTTKYKMRGGSKSNNIKFNLPAGSKFTWYDGYKVEMNDPTLPILAPF